MHISMSWFQVRGQLEVPAAAAVRMCPWLWLCVAVWEWLWACTCASGSVGVS